MVTEVRDRTARTQQVVSEFIERVREQDYDRLRAMLSADFTAEYPHTGETFGPESYISLSRDYPGGPWRIHVEEQVIQGDRAVCRATLENGEATFFVACFITVDASDRVSRIVEVWTSEVAPRQLEYRPN
jgi:hypothetical protein